MGRLIIHTAMSVNGAFEAPAPGKWFVLDADSGDASQEQLLLADAMVLGRKTYEGLAAVWPQLVDDPALGRYAGRINSMPKYVASRSLRGPLAWNATLIEGGLADGVRALKDKHQGNLIVSGTASWPMPSPTRAWSTSSGSGCTPTCGRRVRGSLTASGRSRCNWPPPRRIPRECCGSATGQPPTSRRPPPARSATGWRVGEGGARQAPVRRPAKRSKKVAQPPLARRYSSAARCPRCSKRISVRPSPRSTRSTMTSS